jgi:hypothetical protein
MLFYLETSIRPDEAETPERSDVFSTLISIRPWPFCSAGLGESLTPGALVGMAVTIVGVWLVKRAFKRK